MMTPQVNKHLVQCTLLKYDLNLKYIFYTLNNFIELLKLVFRAENVVAGMSHEL